MSRAYWIGENTEESDFPIDNDGIDVPLPNYAAGRAIQIQRRRTNKFHASNSLKACPTIKIVDQIFTMRQILKNTRKKKIYTHHFRRFLSRLRQHEKSCLNAALSERGDAKLIRMCKQTLSNTKSTIRIDKNLTAFDRMMSCTRYPTKLT